MSDETVDLYEPIDYEKEAERETNIKGQRRPPESKLDFSSYFGDKPAHQEEGEEAEQSRDEKGAATVDFSTEIAGGETCSILDKDTGEVLFSGKGNLRKYLEERPGSKLWNATVENEDLSDMGTTFRRASFKGGSIRGAKFDGNDAEDLDLRGCDCRGASFRNSRLTMALVDENTIFDEHTDFTGAIINGVQLDKLSSGVRSKMNLKGARRQ